MDGGVAGGHGPIKCGPEVGGGVYHNNGLP